MKYNHIMTTYFVEVTQVFTTVFTIPKLLIINSEVMPGSGIIDKVAKVFGLNYPHIMYVYIL